MIYMAKHINVLMGSTVTVAPHIWNSLSLRVRHCCIIRQFPITTQNSPFQYRF